MTRQVLEPAAADVPVEQPRLPIMKLGPLLDLRIDMTVDHHQVAASVMIDVDEVNAPADVFHGRPESGLEHAILERPVAVVVIHVRHIVAEVRLDDVEVAVLVVIGHGDPHAALFLAVVVQGDAGDEAIFLECSVPLVVIEQARRGITGDIEVGISVVVEVRRHDREPITASRLADAACTRNIGKPALAFVVKQVIACKGEPSRTAHHRQALPLAVPAIARLGHLGAVELEVVDDDEVQPAVQIVIDERAARIPARGGGAQSCGVGGVTKPAIALVVVQDAAAVVRDEQVCAAVVVVVAGTDALGPTDAVQASPSGHVLEAQAAAIPIQMAGRRPAGTVVLERRRVGDEHIHQAVGVGVENGHAGSGGLENVSLSILSADDGGSGEARVGRHVAIIDGDRRQIGFDRLRRTCGASGGAHALKRAGGGPCQ